MELGKHVSREGEEKEGGWKHEGKRGLQGEKAGSHSSLAFLSGTVWTPHYHWGPCSVQVSLTSRGTPYVEPGARKFLEILELRLECG